jgi:thiosulfate dehydrogenase [quinone] large subunit
MVDRIDSRTHIAVRHWPIAALRVYTGLFFTWNGLGKVLRDNFADGMAGFLNAQLDNSFAFYRPFIESAVLPNKTMFAALVSWGELTVGLLMIVGLATRYAAAVGAILVLNFWFAKGMPVFAGTNQDVAWLVIFIVLGMVPAGRIAGLDDGLCDRLPFLR